MNTYPPFRIDFVPGFEVVGELRSEVLALCSQAYEEDFSAYFALLSPAVHVIGRLEDEIVSHAAWVERELRVERRTSLRTAYVEAVATKPDHQGMGYASRLLAEIPARVTDFDLAALSPSDEAFYLRLGWEPWRGPLSYRDSRGAHVPTPDERIMIHRLPRTPTTLDVHAAISTQWRPLEVW